MTALAAALVTVAILPFNDLSGSRSSIGEAIRDKGSTVIVPSSAVETMGLGGMLALNSMGKQQ